MGCSLRQLFVLLLACVWFTSTSYAETLSAEYPFCQPEHSPCCPLPVSNGPGSCPVCLTPLKVAEKHEARTRQDRPAPRRVRPFEWRLRPTRELLPPEFTAGLRYLPNVFQLKEDLRV